MDLGGRSVIVLGAGAVGREVLGNLLAANPARAIQGFLDDDPAKWGTSVEGYPVLGGTDRLGDAGRDWMAIIGIGYPEPRRRVIERAAGYGIDFASVLHPSVIASAPGRPAIGRGVSISAGCVVAPSARFEDHAFVSHACVVNHDTVIGAGACVLPAAVIAGNVRIGPGVLVGTRATILQGLTIGAGAVIGAGALVTRDVAAGETVVGVPAKPLPARGA